MSCVVFTEITIFVYGQHPLAARVKICLLNRVLFLDTRLIQSERNCDVRRLEEQHFFAHLLGLTSLPSHEDIHIQILVSLPPTYPDSSPPQLQLLSRYIGAFGVDSGLFGDILKTYISSQSHIEFVPDTAAVFDGLQHAIERCNGWYEERLSEEAVGKLIREEERSRHTEMPLHDDSSAVEKEKIPIHPISIPELVEAEPIVDRKSVFIGRACRISHPSQVCFSERRTVSISKFIPQVQGVLSYLLSDRRIARAAHPIINAWRCTVNGVVHQGIVLLNKPSLRNLLNGF